MPAVSDSCKWEVMMRFYRSEKKYGAAAYIWFIFALLFFSGLFRGAPVPLSLLDLSTYQGKFGTIIEGAEPGFVGEGGTGLSQQFATVLTILPSIMFSMGVLDLVEHYGGMKVAGACSPRYDGKLWRIVLPVYGGESRSSHHHGAAFKAYCSKYHAVYLKKY